ncbi:hypothetical protein G6F43_011597 [Rhizopus delemar]|nr:hypothetical protein G6F43_011597 [Rhizopus delemar]
MFHARLAVLSATSIGRNKRQRTTASSSEDADQQIGEAVQEIRGALLERTTGILVEDISNFRATQRSALLIRNQIRRIFAKHPNLKTALEQSTLLVERDNVFAGSSDLPVGTVIKRACLKYFDKYKALKEEERYLVELRPKTCHILDLIKLSSQKNLFTKSDWKLLKCKFSKRLDNNTFILDLSDAKLQEIEKLAKTAPSEARAIAGKYEANHRGASSTLFDFYYEYLKTLEFKKGDTIGNSGILTKSGFKVDLRVVRDVISKINKRKEENTANAKTAKLDASIGKIDNDRCKLLLESKCVLDQLINVTRDDTIVVCALQLAGLQATLFSLVLEADGLYVALNEASASLPTSESDLKSL